MTETFCLAPFSGYYIPIIDCSISVLFLPSTYALDFAIHVTSTTSSSILLKSDHAIM